MHDHSHATVWRLDVQNWEALVLAGSGIPAVDCIERLNDGAAGAHTGWDRVGRSLQQRRRQQRLQQQPMNCCGATTKSGTNDEQESVLPREKEVQQCLWVWILKIGARRWCDATGSGGGWWCGEGVDDPRNLASDKGCEHTLEHCILITGSSHDVWIFSAHPLRNYSRAVSPEECLQEQLLDGWFRNEDVNRSNAESKRPAYATNEAATIPEFRLNTARWKVGNAA